MNPDRRDVLTTLSSVLAALALCGRAAAQGAPADESLFPSPEGALDDAESETLWTFCQGLGLKWGMTALAKEDFQGVIDMKTTIAPSYLAEYRSALAMIHARSASRDLSGWIDDILLAPADSASEDGRRICHFRRYVLGEFINLHLMQGGFKAFWPAENYRGFMAGPQVYRRSRIVPTAGQMRPA